MTGKIDFASDAPLLMSGGLSRSKSLIEVISKITELKVETNEHALFAGAIGACICAHKKNSK